MIVDYTKTDKEKEEEIVKDAEKFVICQMLFVVLCVVVIVFLGQ